MHDRSPFIPANSLRYALCSCFSPGTQLHPLREFRVVFPGVIVKPDVPVFSIGLKDPSLIARALPFDIACAISAQLSDGSLNQSSNTLVHFFDASNAFLIGFSCSLFSKRLSVYGSKCVSSTVSSSVNQA